MGPDRIVVEVTHGTTPGRYVVSVRAIHGHSGQQIVSAMARTSGVSEPLLDAGAVNGVMQAVREWIEERPAQLPLR